MPEDADQFIRKGLLPDDVDEFVEVAAGHSIWDIAKRRKCHRIDLADPEIGIHHEYSQRSLVEQGLELGRTQSHRFGRLVAETRHFQMRLDSGQQFARAERLDQIVVRAGMHSLDPRLFTRTRRKQNDRNVSEIRVGTKFAQQPEAVQPRHHHVCQHQVGPACLCRAQCRQPVANGLYLVTVLYQQPADIVAHIGVVVRQQNASRFFRMRLRRCGAVGHVERRARSVRQPAQDLFYISVAPHASGSQGALRPDPVGRQV